ncbi:MAG: hypothetical protein APF77_24595 [Clostridia bacterium BRH_c25]|nr:MAG: hypothetical protein APF77_24595 [Clostridia bacterium BRH_c25]
MCQTVSGYKWSSDIFYRKGIKGFVNVDIVLSMLDADRDEAVKKYTELMAEKEEKDYAEEKVIGDEAYQLMCLSRRKTEERKRLDEILIETGINDEDYELVKSGSRKSRLTQYKLEYTRAALALKYTYKEIAHNINITESSVKDMIYKNEGANK